MSNGKFLAAHELDRPRPHSVAIVAMGASSSDYINRAAQHGGRHAVADETWAINAMGGIIEHDRLFAMDDMSELILDARRHHKKVASGMLEWLPQHPGPVYMIRAYPQIPGAVEYPVVDVLNEIGFPYFNNTVAYTIGYAMLIGVKTLRLYGCDFTYRNSNAGEEGRGCVEWLLGIAGNRGVNIELSQGTTLMDADIAPDKRLYGYDEPAIPEQYCPACMAEASECKCETPHEAKWRILFPERKQEPKAESVPDDVPNVVGG